MIGSLRCFSDVRLVSSGTERRVGRRLLLLLSRLRGLTEGKGFRSSGRIGVCVSGVGFRTACDCMRDDGMRLDVVHICTVGSVAARSVRVYGDLGR